MRTIELDDILIGPTEVSKLLQATSRPLAERTVATYASDNRIPVLKASKGGKIFSKADILAWDKAGRPQPAK